MNYEQEASVFAQFRERAVAILQTEGLAGLIKRAVKRLMRKPLHHSSYIFALSLDRPIHPPLPKVKVEIGQVKATDDEDLETLLQIDPWADSKAHLLGRLTEGQQCYVARFKGQIVSSLWWVNGGFYSSYLSCEFKLAANEICYRSGVTELYFVERGSIRISSRNPPVMLPTARIKPAL